MINQFDKRQIAGWIAVGISTIVICFWAFWGIIENFHEGWYFVSWLSNVGLMFVQYLSPMLLFMGVALVSIFWPRFGSSLHVVLALFAVWFFQAVANPVMFVLIMPLIGLAVLYWYGRPRPRKVAASLVIGLPIATLIIAGIGPIQRVSRRVDDGNLNARFVKGNGVELTWAPDGPGWPRAVTNWSDAVQICRQLREDGLSLATVPQDVWRLPSVDESVRSMALHGQNSNGVWNVDVAQATYETTPDKESPLWNVHSQVIYWWTETEVDEDWAYIIVYDGKVWPRSKKVGPAYLGFRCVKGP